MNNDDLDSFTARREAAEAAEEALERPASASSDDAIKKIEAMIDKCAARYEAKHRPHRGDDYTLVTDGIAKAIADFGTPLSDRQCAVMAGTVASYLLKIEREGLDALIKNLACRKKEPNNAS